MTAMRNEAPTITPAEDTAGRVERLDWQQVSKDLDAQGCAMIEGLITPDECAAFAEACLRDTLALTRTAGCAQHGSANNRWLSKLRACGPRSSLISTSKRT